MTEVDLRWLACGDYAVLSGDFDDTESPGILSYELQETISRLRSSLNEFMFESMEISANLETFLGREVSDSIVTEIKGSVKHALTYYPYLDDATAYNIRVLILDAESIGVYLKLANPAYGEVFINVYMDFSNETVSVLVEESGDVHYPQ